MSHHGYVAALRFVVLVAVCVTASAAIAAPNALGKPRWQTLPLPPAMPKADFEDTVEVAGARIFYATYGQGEPVVLLHGGLGNSSHFAFQLPALIDKFRVIAIDSRGQGRSTRGRLPMSYDLMADDVIAVLDKLGVARASFVGWSDGGEVALKLGIWYPERVDRLFVFGANYDASGSKPRSGPMPTFSAYTAKCRSDYHRLSRSGLPYSALVTALLPLWRNSTGITRDQLRSIKAPVMMADGDHDEVILLDQIEEMAELIPNAQLTVFNDASHFALWQDPESFNATLVEFLRGAAPDSTASGSPAALELLRARRR
jgi:pimeloyl-ACP methyl ester carboxylesterase